MSARRPLAPLALFPLLLALVGCNGSPTTPPVTPVPDGGPVPPPWQQIDLGTTSAAGSASAASGVFTLYGPRDDADPIASSRFVYQAVQGDVDLMAQVANRSDGHVAARSGLMIRDSLDVDGYWAFSALAPDGGVLLEQRTTLGDDPAVATGPPPSGEGYLRLVRQDNVLTAYGSADGTTWSAMGQATLALPPLVYVGLAVSGHDTAQYTQGGFSHVVLNGAVPSPPTLGYVVDGADPTASDDNDGSADHPWKTLQKAATALVPGDTVTVRPATYTGDVSPQSSGTLELPIRYQALPGAVLSGASFLLMGKSFITLDGLQLENAPADGIVLTGPGSDVTLTHNTVVGATGSCISAWGVPANTDPTHCAAGAFQCLQRITVDNNVLEQCSRGGTDGFLEIAQGVDDFEVRGNLVQTSGGGASGGTGIELKEGVSNGVVAQNTIVNPTHDPGIYVNGGGLYPATNPDPPTQNLLVSGNRLSGVGIRIDAEHQAEMSDIQVENNVVTGGPQDGISVFHYPGSTGAMDRITLVNNTAFGNGTQNSSAAGVTLNHPTATQVLIRNNLAFGNLGVAFILGQSTNDHNLSQDPGFVDAGAGDFHLAASSPALGAGVPTSAPVIDFDGFQRDAVAPTVGANER